MIPRRHNDLIRRDLAWFPSVVLLGPRQVGKTTLARGRDLLLLLPGQELLAIEVKRSSSPKVPRGFRCGPPSSLPRSRPPSRAGGPPIAPRASRRAAHRLADPLDELLRSLHDALEAGVAPQGIPGGVVAKAR